MSGAKRETRIDAANGATQTSAANVANRATAANEASSAKSRNEANTANAATNWTEADLANGAANSDATSRRCWTAGLFLGAAVIWLRDLNWLASESGWIALAGIPLVAAMARPWRLRRPARDVDPRHCGGAAALTACGAAIDSSLVLAAAWTWWLSAFLSAHFEQDPRQPWNRLLGLAWLGFPWLETELAGLGWWFRLSGAAAAEWALASVGADVSRFGVDLYWSDVRISVGEACSGLRGLQAMLIGGTFSAWWLLGGRPGYWWHLPILFGAAWLANFLRILTTAAGASWLSPQWVSDHWHFWQGWLLLCLMFVICGLAFQRLATGKGPENA